MDYDYYDNEQPNLLAENDAFNKLGDIAGFGLGAQNVTLRQGNYSSEDKFKLIARATIIIINEVLKSTFTDENRGNLHQESDSPELSVFQIKNMLDTVSKVPDLKHKNPSAFALGYMVAVHSDYKTFKINPSIMTRIVDAYTVAKSEILTSIDITDIVRYSRFCLLNGIGWK
jgi:hypothetical protein